MVLVGALWFQGSLKVTLFLIGLHELIMVCVNMYPRSIIYEGMILNTDGKRILSLCWETEKMR
jgi:hypothetical protein